jgi:hypothetical protein
MDLLLDQTSLEIWTGMVHTMGALGSSVEVLNWEQGILACLLAEIGGLAVNYIDCSPTSEYPHRAATLCLIKTYLAMASSVLPPSLQLQRNLDSPKHGYCIHFSRQLVHLVLPLLP